MPCIHLCCFYISPTCSCCRCRFFYRKNIDSLNILKQINIKTNRLQDQWAAQPKGHKTKFTVHSDINVNQCYWWCNVYDLQAVGILGHRISGSWNQLFAQPARPRLSDVQDQRAVGLLGHRINGPQNQWIWLHIHSGVWDQ